MKSTAEFPARRWASERRRLSDTRDGRASPRACAASVYRHWRTGAEMAPQRFEKIDSAPGTGRPERRLCAPGMTKERKSCVTPRLGLAPAASLLKEPAKPASRRATAPLVAPAPAWARRKSRVAVLQFLAPKALKKLARLPILHGAP